MDVDQGLIRLRDQMFQEWNKAFMVELEKHLPPKRTKPAPTKKQPLQLSASTSKKSAPTASKPKEATGMHGIYFTDRGWEVWRDGGYYGVMPTRDRARQLRKDIIKNPENYKPRG